MTFRCDTSWCLIRAVLDARAVERGCRPGEEHALSRVHVSDAGGVLRSVLDTLNFSLDFLIFQSTTSHIGDKL